jgi:hypothetical protein
MLEAPIHRRPDFVLREWKVQGLRVSLDGDGYTAHGLDYSDGKPMNSGVIKYYDSVQHLALYFGIDDTKAGKRE